jgi:hypothetical protein
MRTFQFIFFDFDTHLFQWMRLVFFNPLILTHNPLKSNSKEGRHLDTRWKKALFLLKNLELLNRSSDVSKPLLFSYRKSFKKSNILLSIFGKILKVQDYSQNFNDFWKNFRLKVSKDH